MTWVPNTIERDWVRGADVEVENLRGTAFTEEAGAHTFRITGRDASGAAFPLEGTVLAKVLRADNMTVDVDGDVGEDGVAELTLVGDCYNVAGRLQIVIYISDGTNSMAIYAAVGNVYRGTSGNELDSGSAVPSLQQMEAAYANAVQATSDANAAALAANTAAANVAANLAPTYSSSGTYAVGDYAIHDGGLYRCIVPITTAEAWTSGHWEQVTFGGDLTALAGDLDDLEDDVAPLKDGSAPVINRVVMDQAVATVNDALPGMPAKELTFNIDPFQEGSGTASSENVRAITPWTGLDGAVSDARMYTRTANRLGRGAISSETGSNSNSNFRLRTGYISVKPGTAYTVRTNFNYAIVFEYKDVDDDETYIGNSGSWAATPMSFTTGAETNKIRIVVAQATPTTSGQGGILVNTDDFRFLDVLENSTSQPISVVFPAGAGDVYGGTLTIHRDGTGTLAVGWAKYTSDLSNTSITIYTGGTSGTANYYFMFVATGGDASSYDNVMSNQFPTEEIGTGNETVGVRMLTSSGGTPRIAIRPSGVSGMSASQFRTYITSLDPAPVFIYKLATPVTYELTADQVGQVMMREGVTVIWADTGDVKRLEYPVDTKAYVDGAVEEKVETISGSTPSITAKAGVRYICGECSTLSITVPASGIIDVVFESGSTPTVLNVTAPSGMTMHWPGWFDATSLEANATYEINILNGNLGVVGVWT